MPKKNCHAELDSASVTPTPYHKRRHSELDSESVKLYIQSIIK